MKRREHLSKMNLNGKVVYLENYVEHGYIK